MQCSLENTPRFFSRKFIAHAMKHVSVTLLFSGIWDSKNRHRLHIDGERGLHVTCHQQKASVALMWCSLRLFFFGYVAWPLAFPPERQNVMTTRCVAHVLWAFWNSTVYLYKTALRWIDPMRSPSASVFPCPQLSTTAIYAYFFGHWFISFAFATACDRKKIEF